jgi:tryptophan halogenase
LNTAGQTPFWKRCREETDLSGVQELLDYYAENGPSGFARYRLPTSLSDFGLEGYFVMLVGNQAPYRNRYQASPGERKQWDQRRALYASQAKKGISVKDALGYVRHPGWKWNSDG